MKKFFAMLLASLLLSCGAHGQVIYTYDETEDIMNGVTLRTIRRFMGSSWLNITAVSADLTMPHLKLDLLKGTSVDALTSMDGLVNSQDGVVAAANADFFDNTRPKYSQGFSIGAEIKDGKLLQSQVNSSMAAALFDGQSLTFDYMSISISVTAPNGAVCPVAHLNKHTDYYGDVLMYTSDWNNGYSPAPGGEVVEVVVENDTVTDIRRGMPPVIIPENGCLLAVSEGASMFFANNFQIGDEIKIDITATPSLENIETAFGGGTMLLKDGQKTKATHTVSGLQPRTCIGTGNDGKKIYIITVDGRQYTSLGVTQDELADIALELGCTDAINLDGGGSTRFMAKTFWNSDIHVINSPTENRKVINAVSVVTDAKPRSAVGIKLRCDVSAMLLGDSVPIQSRFYDENGLTVWLSEEEPQWEVEGVQGSLSSGIFTPFSGGQAKITAIYKGAPSEPIYIDVLDSIDGITVPQQINLSLGESYELMPEIFGAGVTAFVQNTALLSPEMSGSAAVLSGNTITAVSEGYSVLTLSRKSVSSSILIKAGSGGEAAPNVSSNTFQDSAEGELLNSNSFSVLACSAVRPTLFSRIFYKNALQKISASDSYGILGSYQPLFLPQGMRTPIAANSYSAIDKGFALIISLPSSGQLSGSNWLSMEKAVASSQAKNIIVLTNAAPNGKTESDTMVFYDYFNKTAESKNVCIVQSGRSNSVSMKGKIRLITIADTAQYRSMNEAIDNASVLRFTMQGNELMYKFDKIYMGLSR